MRRVRLGVGERTSAATAAAVARGWFLMAIECFAPQVIVQLLSGVFPKRVWHPPPSEAELASLLATWRKGGVASLGTSPHASCCTDEQLEALLSWAAAHHIDEPWILKAAWHQLAFHAANPSVVLRPYWVRSEFGDLGDNWPRLGDEQGRIVVEDEWDPMFETRGHARKRVVSALDRRLQEIEGQCEKLGLKPIRPKNPRHFEWLVLWQCCGWNATEIFKHAFPGKEPEPRLVKTRGCEAKDTSTIHKALAKTASLIGLDLRRGRGGHPRKHMNRR